MRVTQNGRRTHGIDDLWRHFNFDIIKGAPRHTVGAIVGEGLAIHAPGLPAGERDERVAQALADVGLPAARPDDTPF